MHLFIDTLRLASCSSSDSTHRLSSNPIGRLKSWRGAELAASVQIQPRAEFDNLDQLSWQEMFHIITQLFTPISSFQQQIALIAPDPLLTFQQWPQVGG